MVVSERHSYKLRPDEDDLVLKDGVVGKGNAGDNNILGSTSNNVLDGRGGQDWLHGSDGNDKVKGGSGDDTVLGGSGNDRLDGGRGADSLTGGLGNDTITGGAGNDVMTGGKGNDVFLINETTPGSDTVKNFSKGDLLRINDRNADGDFTAGEDYNIEQVGSNALILILDADGDVAGSVTLRGVNEDDLTIVEDPATDDGMFTIE